MDSPTNIQSIESRIQRKCRDLIFLIEKGTRKFNSNVESKEAEELNEHANNLIELITVIKPEHL
jgi:hypothetical protein